MTKSRKDQIEAMLADDPNDPFLRYGLAMEYVSAGDLGTAVRLFQELIQVAPDYVPAYVQAGQLCARLGRENEAKAIFGAGIDTARKQGDHHAAGEMEGFVMGME